MNIRIYEHKYLAYIQSICCPTKYYNRYISSCGYGFNNGLIVDILTGEEIGNGKSMNLTRLWLKKTSQTTPTVDNIQTLLRLNSFETPPSLRDDGGWLTTDGFDRFLALEIKSFLIGKGFNVTDSIG